MCEICRWQYEVHRKASESPLIVRVKVMDEEQRKGTGISVLDKQLCCACNHILHTAWVEQEDDGEIPSLLFALSSCLPSYTILALFLVAGILQIIQRQAMMFICARTDDETEAPTDTHDYSLKHVLAPRSCPDHMEFLGQSKPLRLCLRYPHEYLKELLLSLDALSPLLLAVPPMERTDAAKEKTVWPLRGLTDDYLGLTIRSQQCGDVGSFTDTAVSLAATTPPTPALCTACRSLRSSRNTGGESLSFAMSPVLSHEANPVANDTTRGLAEEEDPKVEDVVDAGATAVSDVAYSCLCPIHAWAQQSTTGAQFSHGKLVRKNRRAHLPQSPLFSDNIFPSLQSLVSKTGASLGVSSVALGNFRKHLLRTKPELKTLVPALVQADEEADAEAKHENVEKDKGESDHDGSRASARGKEMEDEKEEEARKHKLQKNAKPVTSRETEKEKYLLDSDSDDDVPLVHRLQRAIGDRVPANTLTPPDKRAYHRKQPSEDKEEQVTATHDKNTRCKLVSKRKHAHGQMEELEHAPTHKHKNTEFSTHREQSPATITREPAPIHVPPASNNDANGSSSLCMPAAEQGGGFAACHDSPLFIHTNPTYARKRWKVIKLCEYTRSDGSRAMTLRIKRKRCKLTPA